MLGQFTLSQDLVLGHFTLSQDLIFKCLDTSHCPKTTHSSVGTLRTVPRPFVLVWGHFTLSQDLVLGHLALFQDLILKFWDTSHCPKTTHSSVGTLRTVPRPFVLVLGHFALSQDCLLKCLDPSYCPKTSSYQCWDSRISSSAVMGQSDLFFFGDGTLRSLSPVPPLEL